MLNNQKRSSFKAGMYLLETLTSGMYNDPLSIYREYIQNAVDSIDMGKSHGKRKMTTINIDLNPQTRSISIRDNGIGIPAGEAERILSSIGSSNKQESGNYLLRGFRGIGRLGGIAFSDKAIFRTKAEGENIESIQEWDCKKLRKLLETKKYKLTLKDLFGKITHFSQTNGLPSKDSYFEVILNGVSSFRNHIFDIAKIRNYIGQVAPVPFDYEHFSFGKHIDEYLAGHLSTFGVYNIYLNGKPIFKPYSNTVKTASKRGGTDCIKNVHFVEIRINNENPIAYGWYGERQELLGSIRKGEIYSGIRVRVGNILLGDAHLLDRCFREERFNSYTIGEIHVDTSQLVPNSRRDDFVDNETKTAFYNYVEKNIGIPISKNIRLRSRLSSEDLNYQPRVNIEARNDMGRVHDDLRSHVFTVSKNNSNYNHSQCDEIINIISMHCINCPKLSSILKRSRG